MVDSSSPTGDCVSSSDEESFECIDGITERIVQASKEKTSMDASIELPDSAHLIDQVAENDAKILEMTEQLKRLVNAPDGATRTVTLAVGSDGRFGIEHLGNLILEVFAGTPAEAAGVRAGDQIISVDGVNVECLSREDIDNLIKEARANGGITMQLRYNPERLRDLNDSEAYWKELNDADVQTDESAAETDNRSDLSQESTNLIPEPAQTSTNETDCAPQHEIPLRTVTLKMEFDESKFGIDSSGTFVTVVRSGSVAERSGVERGDEIISLNGVKFKGYYDDSRTRRIYERALDDGHITLVLRRNPEGLRKQEEHGKDIDGTIAFWISFFIFLPLIFIMSYSKCNSASIAFGITLVSSSLVSYAIRSIVRYFH